MNDQASTDAARILKDLTAAATPFDGRASPVLMAMLVQIAQQKQANPLVVEAVASLAGLHPEVKLPSLYMRMVPTDLKGRLVRVPTG